MEQLLQIAEIQVTYIPFSKPDSMPIINSSQDAFDILQAFYPRTIIYVQEIFTVVYLNRANRVIGVFKMSIGGLTGTLVDIRLILSVALKTLSCGIILCHNHPSGNLQPSHADKNLTDQIRQASRFMELCLLDHLIITEGAYFSFADAGIIL